MFLMYLCLLKIFCLKNNLRRAYVSYVLLSKKISGVLISIKNILSYIVVSAYANIL